MDGLMCCGVCCMLLSIWAIIQLTLMGFFFKMETTALLFEAEAHTFENADDFIRLTKENYSIVAINCWIAAAMYVVTAFASYMCMVQARKAAKKRAEIQEDDDLSCRPPKIKVKSKPKQK